MSEVQFSNKTELTGTREKVAKAITELIREEGPKRTAELRDQLYEKFDQEYSKKSSFHRTLGYIRSTMVEEDLVDTVRVDSEGSRKTWKWKVKH